MDLKASLAINIMGWVPVCGMYWIGAPCSGEFDCDLGKVDCFAFQYDDGGNWVAGREGTWCDTPTYNWNPTTDANDCFKIVREARKLGVYVTIANTQCGWDVVCKRNGHAEQCSVPEDRLFFGICSTLDRHKIVNERACSRHARKKHCKE
jgi:hypothetical protein